MAVIKNPFPHKKTCLEKVYSLCEVLKQGVNIVYSVWSYLENSGLMG